MGLFCCSIYILLCILCTWRVSSQRIKYMPLENCPDGCLCHNINCLIGRTNVRCDHVDVSCANANVTSRLEVLPQNATRLYITGEDMGHTTLDIFARFGQLSMLALPQNQIRSLSLSKNIGNLIYLNLRENRLCFLPTRNLTLLRKLKKLKLPHNNLTFIHEITFPPRLKYLNLSHNHIESPRSGSFKRLRRLLTLNLENNSITVYMPAAFRHLQALESLYMDHNKIRHLGPYALKSLASVSLVSLTHNLISFIDPTAFSLLGVRWHGLHEIRLEHNEIVILDENFFSILNPIMQYYAIYIAGNPLFCDCEMMRIRDRSSILLRDTHLATCSTPETLKGMTLKGLLIKDCSDE